MAMTEKAAQQIGGREATGSSGRCMKRIEIGSNETKQVPKEAETQTTESAPKAFKQSLLDTAYFGAREVSFLK